MTLCIHKSRRPHFPSHARIHAGSPIQVADSRDEQALLAIEELISRGVYHDYGDYFDADGNFVESSS